MKISTLKSYVGKTPQNNSLRALRDTLSTLSTRDVKQAPRLPFLGPCQCLFPAAFAHFILQPLNERVLPAWGSITQGLKLPLVQPHSEASLLDSRLPALPVI